MAPQPGDHRLRLLWVATSRSPAVFVDETAKLIPALHPRRRYGRRRTISVAALASMFKHITASNRAGGWRKLKHERKAHARGADVPRAEVAVAN